MAAYIRAERPDRIRILQAPGDGEVPRYTSFADLHYIDSPAMQVRNRGWFYGHIRHLADYAIARRDLSEVIKMLQAVFPPGKFTWQEPLDSIYNHVAKLRPGLKEKFGSLAAPTTMPHVTASTCETPSSQHGLIIVHNDTAKPLSVVSLNGGPTLTIPAREWRRFLGQLKLPDGRCLAAGDEPAFARITRQ